ncbi:hypothetical protein NC653_024936 [Populus alba x Populus x berolinensis]|uniref:Uncharacterized protein n=1 Tax=Populus alba x Populus x berolinensis TaxID=444605 RepID=A0AAD6Q8F6_9ROSI|nr:hypothetical protein NC653_024936 [Populus alba x Populus x berolinensis]
MFDRSTWIPVLSGSNSLILSAAQAAMSTFLCTRQAAKSDPQITSLGSIGILFMRLRASLSNPARPSKSTMHP